MFEYEGEFIGDARWSEKTRAEIGAASAHSACVCLACLRLLDLASDLKSLRTILVRIICGAVGLSEPESASLSRLGVVSCVLQARRATSTGAGT